MMLMLHEERLHQQVRSSHYRTGHAIAGRIQRQHGKPRDVRLVLVAAVLGPLLAGCGGSDMARPRGIGSDADDYKRSPCACVLIVPRGGVPLKAADPAAITTAAVPRGWRKDAFDV